MFMCPSKSPWLFILGNARGWGWGCEFGVGSISAVYCVDKEREVISHMYIYPWTMNRYGEPTFHPGIKGSHRIWSTCLIDVITHTVALCTRSQWQIYNGDPTRKTALLVLTFGLYFLTSYPVLQQSDYCLISFNKSTPMWIYGPLS